MLGRSVAAKSFTFRDPVKILFITSRLPWPLDKGDRLRAYHQMRMLQKEHEVHLFSLTESTPTEEARAALDQVTTSMSCYKMNKPRRWIRLLFAALSSRPFQVHWFYQSAANQQLHAWMKDLQPDVIHCQLLRMAEYVRDDHQVPRVLDFMDALSAGMSRRAALRPIWSRWIFHWEAQRLARYESVIFDYFDAKTIISAADQKLIAHPSRKEISVVPNGVDSDYFKVQEPQRTVGEQRIILFTGNMSYPPNIDAALVLVKDILPLVTHQSVKVVIAGTQPTSEILSLACANVEVTGWVPDLRVAYSRADVFVAPLRIGTGQQNKILEAMSMGIPCITTEHVLNGLPFQAGTRPPLSIAATPEETAKAIDDLLIDNNQVLERGKKSREWIEKYNSWDAQTKALEQSFVNSTLYKPEEGAWKIKK